MDEFCGGCQPADSEALPPVARLVRPADVADFSPADESLCVIGTREGKVTKIMGLEEMVSLKTLVFRSCLISDIEGLETLTRLEKLELYDNQIEYISGIHHLSNLRVLDLSFNAIRQLINFGQYVPLLEELYVAQNKLRKIEGLEGLPHLRILDLGANRIRVIEGLQNNTALKSLWLGKNKIEQLDGLDSLTALEQLDVQNNRLTSWSCVEGGPSGLAALLSLRELYLACNRLADVSGLPRSPTLTIVDLSSNGVQSVQSIDEHSSLEEVWMTSSGLASFDALLPLTQLPKLQCLYLEHSPVAKDFEYRMKVTKMIPSLQQLDATAVHRLS